MLHWVLFQQYLRLGYVIHEKYTLFESMNDKYVHTFLFFHDCQALFYYSLLITHIKFSLLIRKNTIMLIFVFVFCVCIHIKYLTWVVVVFVLLLLPDSIEEHVGAAEWAGCLVSCVVAQ